MIRSHSRSAVPLFAVLSIALVGACGGKATSAQAPVSTITLPSGAALKPWDTTKVNMASPAGMVAVSTTQIYVALNNFGPVYSLNGPGMLVGFNPYTGSMVAIDLAVATPVAPAERSCTNSGVVKVDSGKLYVACTGDYGAQTGPGRAVVEVDPATNAVTRILALPSGASGVSFLPNTLAPASTKIWLGNAAGPTLVSVDRTTFTLVDGASASQPQIAANCTNTGGLLPYISDAAVYGGELFVLCGSNSGEIVRLDAATGAFKDKQLVGAQPVKMTQLPDGRIAIVNSVSGTVSFVTIAPAALTVAKDAIVISSGADLEGVAFFDRYLFTVSSATQTVQKIDLAASGGPKIVSEANTGNNTGPLSVVPLDANHAVVSASLAGKIVGVTFP
jgi:hypothetical protein